MSLKNFKFVALILVCGLGIGFSLPFLSNSVSRTLASVSEEKPFPAPKLDLWGHSPYGKVGQSMEVWIEAVDGIPDNDNQELRLIAHVNLNHQMDQELGYRWVLPEGASLISGELEDSWPGIKPGQSATSEISIAGVSREGLVKTVTLQVFGVSGGVKYANSGSFTTDPRSLVGESEELALKKKTEVGKIRE
jgi:hypothetical protein